MTLINFFEGMTPTDAELFKDQFVAAADDAIALLRTRCLDAAGLAKIDFDYSDKSLTPVFEVVAPLFSWADDPQRWADDQLPFWAEHSARPKHHLWIVDGWIHYYARVLERSGPLWWDWERDRHLHSTNQPVLVGFRSNRRFAPFDHAASVLVNAARQRNPGVVGTSIASWLSRIPDSDDKATPPEWFDGFVDKHVTVQVALAVDLNSEAVWPETPAGLDGAWRIDLEEGLDAVLGEGAIGALLDHMRRHPAVETATWGDEDMIVAHAPSLSSSDVQRVVLRWLNQRWREHKT